jgi:glutamyl-Q tRNA(Asp) synthetase
LKRRSAANAANASTATATTAIASGPRGCGRFAPSPTGDLHLGSLLAAAGSYLDARHAGQGWLLRIEDLDTPRTVPGAETRILATLEACGFEWDATPVRQSSRFEAYLGALAALGRAGRLFECSCSRKTLDDDGERAYPGTCRLGPTRAGPTATRFRVEEGDYAFDDRIQGPLGGAWRTRGDVVVRRRDGIFAYQLAVVVDDAWQGITDVVRGADLLDSTPWQIALARALGAPPVRYAHLPVLVESDGCKLAKSRRAVAVDPARARQALETVLTLLGLPPPAELSGAPPAELWAWAVPRWSVDPLRDVRTLPAPE